MFEPYTFGYEWETWILKPNMMPIEKKEIEWLAAQMREKLPWSRVGKDWSREFDCVFLELRSGIMRSWDELEERTEALVGEAAGVCREKDWVFLPSGCNPTFGGATGLHTHIGSINEYGMATRFANDMARYACALAALMANSPVWGTESGEFKSYRVQKYAEFCSIPRRIVDPEFAQWSWGDDVCVKIGAKPTVEIRIGDGPSSSRLAKEYVALGVGLFFSLSEKGQPRKLGRIDYIESLINRWRAAKYGLQARFSWGGETVDASYLVEEILQIAEFGLRKIGTSLENLWLIRKMVDKRQTQADFQSLIAKRNGDPHRFSRELANLLSRGDPFQEYLEMAQPLDSVEPMKVEDYLLSKVAVDTPYSYLHELLFLPHAVLQENLSKLESEGKIELKKSPEKGVLYSSKRPRKRRKSP